MASLVCWKCGASLANLSLPFQRLDECPRCRAQLHVCRLCEFYSITVARQCREPVADEVKEKERANFCGYFTPRFDVYSDTGQIQDIKAKSELESLFGLSKTKAGVQSPEDQVRAELDKLFKKD